jgi:hypothetical protein
LLERIFQAPELVMAQDLARHKELNPHGLTISIASQDALVNAHALLVEPLTRIRALLPLIRDDDLQDLASQGHLRLLRLKDTPEVRAARQQNAERGLTQEPMFHGKSFYDNAKGIVWFVRHDGNYYGAGPEDLKRYSAAAGAYVRSCYESYVRLCALANALGMLTDENLENALDLANKWEHSHVGYEKVNR